MNLGGGLPAQEQDFEHEPLAAQEQGPSEADKAVAGHGRGWQRTSGSGSQAGCGVFSLQVSRFARKLTVGSQSSATCDPQAGPVRILGGF